MSPFLIDVALAIAIMLLVKEVIDHKDIISKQTEALDLIWQNYKELRGRVEKLESEK